MVRKKILLPVPNTTLYIRRDAENAGKKEEKELSASSRLRVR